MPKDASLVVRKNWFKIKSTQLNLVLGYLNFII